MAARPTKPPNTQEAHTVSRHLAGRRTLEGFSSASKEPRDLCQSQGLRVFSVAHIFTYVKISFANGLKQSKNASQRQTARRLNFSPPVQSRRKPTRTPCYRKTQS